ncbi:hypothetical protein GE09DRAFT_1158513 [Coniochaeta sp. 2T2.1]|nr:hypothetical protein GE09DRAFT_1158513 [Coniochaeta sp. 2T2.1]
MGPVAFASLLLLNPPLIVLQTGDDIFGVLKIFVCAGRSDRFAPSISGRQWQPYFDDCVALLFIPCLFHTFLFVIFNSHNLRDGLIREREVVPHRVLCRYHLSAASCRRRNWFRWGF